MEGLLIPLEQLEENARSFTEGMVTENGKVDDPKLDTKIPIPSPEFLRKQVNNPGKVNSAPLVKYAKEYEEFCKWSGTPKEARIVKTAVLWEKKHHMTKGYTDFFKNREDFNEKRLQAFWEWMFDVYPDVVHAIYKRAVDKSSKDAQIFVELLSKRMNLEKPKSVVQPMMLVGIPQEKIDSLFVPKEYQNIKDIIPGGDKT